jgi:hypothetical protein
MPKTGCMSVACLCGMLFFLNFIYVTMASIFSLRRVLECDPFRGSLSLLRFSFVCCRSIPHAIFESSPPASLCLCVAILLSYFVMAVVLCVRRRIRITERMDGADVCRFEWPHGLCAASDRCRRQQGCQEHCASVAAFLGRLLVFFLISYCIFHMYLYYPFLSLGLLLSHFEGIYVLLFSFFNILV